MTTEITNELLARIYGAYMGCEILHELTGRKAHLISIGKNTLNFSYLFEDCKLQLTPISECLEEHGIEVAKMFGYVINRKEKQPNHVPDRKGLIHRGQTIVRGFSNGGTVEIFPMMQEVIDYLRSKGYDCGYGEIPSLIDAGIAIDKKTLNIQP